mmetsp:Transcript_571/g.1060  ORF Transcript_571/g.1060 Transcript_571/m.1060 type:complete len:98 (+) Transcript_571:170-463(+)
MMYGFGDAEQPLPECMEMVEDLITSFMMNVTHQTAALSGHRGKLRIEDLLWLIRKCPKMYNRALELMAKNEEIKRARRDHTLTGNPSEKAAAAMAGQ